MSRVSRRRRSGVLGLGLALLVQAAAASSVLAVAVPVSAIGVLPVAMPDTGAVVHGRLRSVGAPGVLGNDVLVGGGFTAQLVSGASDGTLSLNANGSYTYRSDLGFVGSDSFRYRVVGGLLGPSLPTTVTITVTNAAPVARADAYTAVADVEKSIGAPGLLANDDDADGDELEVDVLTETTHGNLNEDDDGSFRYKADDDFAGIDTFTYRITDGLSWSDTVTVRITVTTAATPPTPAPTPTTAPTGAPTPTPGPNATPRPSATPRPNATPTPGPNVTPTPGPNVTPTPRPGSTPAPTMTPLPGATASPRPGSTPVPGSSPTPGPASSPSPGSTGPSSEPSAGPSATAGPSDGASVAPVIPPGSGPTAPGTSPGAAGPVDPIRVAAAEPGSGVAFVPVSVVFDGFDWAVPALVLTVPGLLLILAVLAQTTIGLAFLPVARRWLGADRRRRA